MKPLRLFFALPVFLALAACFINPKEVKYIFLPEPMDTTTAETNGDTWDPGAGWLLAWSDEFNGTSLDTGNWTHDIGIGPNSDGWGNQEAQYYTDRWNNSWVTNGHLVIKAIKENYGNRSYTSARIHSLGKAHFRYGKIAARIRMPYGTNQWPAFWMMGTNRPSAGWPDCGEIDIMEYRGDIINKASFAIHGPGYSGGDSKGDSYSNILLNLTNSFHVFETVWSNNIISFYVDKTNYYNISSNTVVAGSDPWVFNHHFYIIMNLAIGSSGTPYTGFLPIDTSVFPTYVFVDWIRVYTN